jgi:hypothetical protein
MVTTGKTASIRQERLAGVVFPAWSLQSAERVHVASPVTVNVALDTYEPSSVEPVWLSVVVPLLKVIPTGTPSAEVVTPTVRSVPERSARLRVPVLVGRVTVHAGATVSTVMLAVVHEGGFEPTF